MNGRIVCPTCEGIGKVWFLLWRSRCPTCQGAGQVTPDFVGSPPFGRPRRPWFSSLFGSSSSSSSYSTVRTKVIEEHWTKNVEVDSPATPPMPNVPASPGKKPAEGEDPNLPLLIDPFAAVGEERSDPDSQASTLPESSEASDPEAGDTDQATAY
jgi:hypothetical protein